MTRCTTFAARLVALRARAGMTQAALAARAGVSQPCISQLEAGRTKRANGKVTECAPGWATVQALAAALGVGVDRFA